MAHEPVNILLVDDQPAKLLTYEAVLETLGENLIRANSARQALEHLLRTEVAVILIDVVMPDLDGFELATMIREHPRFEQTAIIFVSAVHMTDLDRLRGYEVGAVDYVPVPVVPDLLRAKVRVFAELYRKTRELERLNGELERRVAERTTELEASTKQLRDSEQRRSLALAAGRMGAWEWDLRTGAMTWDQGQHHIAGSVPESFTPTAETVQTIVHPDDRIAYSRAMASLAAGGAAGSVEFRIQRPDGEVRWCIVGAAPTIGGAGEVEQVSGVTYDITERKTMETALRESEERLRIAQQTSGIGIWDWDLVADRLIWIGEVYRSWGLVRWAGEPVRDIIRSALHPEDQERVGLEIEAALRLEQPYAAEFRVIGQDGTIRWLAGRGEVICDAFGRPVRMIGTDIDVTERRAATEVLAEANVQLERRVEERTRERQAALATVHEMQKMESLGQLTGGVAHDFNNLLMAVLGNARLLRKRVGNEPRTLRLIDGAIMGAERGVTLTKRMLAFARRQELKPEKVDVARLLTGMSDLLRHSIGPGVQMAVKFPAGLPLVQIDPHQLELAVLNLAVNSRDAMPDGGGLSIGASAARHTASSVALEPGDYVRLVVSDSGSGMDEATRQRATEPFFTTKGVGKGTGLGLSMVHGLAAQSGGAMTIISRPKLGTTIELWLPVAEPAADDGAAPRPEPSTDLPHPVATRPCRVLIVDDDALIREGTAELLEDLGHTVLEAASAARALDALRSGAEVDLVITDHAMPGVTGLELARQIEATWPSLPVLLATGYADLPDADLAQRPRLAKPYSQEELAAEIARLVGRVLPANVVPIEAGRRA